MDNSWQYFLQRVNETDHPSVAFWCLKAVQDAIQGSYTAMQPAQKIDVSFSQIPGMLNVSYGSRRLP